MTQETISKLLRDYVRNNLSPKDAERLLISNLYDSLKIILGESNCLQIGSYPRFTAITPLHDLDVLYIIGDTQSSIATSQEVLNDLYNRLNEEYQSPTSHNVKIEYQTHSITILFFENDGDDVLFSLDIVPAIKHEVNEFGLDKYLVPELLKVRPSRRKHLYQELSQDHKEMGWIPTDPRGYIEMSRTINDQNSDFRKTVKFIKGWKHAVKTKDSNFKFKSFHIEQIVIQYFFQNVQMDIYSAIFHFFCDLPKHISSPQITDRADSTKYIDAYIEDMTEAEKEKILNAADNFLIKLEDLSEESNIDDLLDGNYYTRKSESEEYLFDKKIPVLIEKNEKIKIIARALARNGFGHTILDAAGIIETDRKIDFSAETESELDIIKWKVKNDNRSPQPRGEITDHHTLHQPENTKFNGNHYVECYGIRNNVCVVRARQNVVLDSWILPKYK